jgi:hypothetical protein
MGSDAAPDSRWPGDVPDHAPTRRRPRRPVPWFRVVLGAAVLGAIGWASLSPGGLKARLGGVDKSINGTVSNLTQSRELDQASKAFDTWYTQQGSYPNYSQSQLDGMPNAGWSEGMDVSWCTPRDVVLTGFTASGTVSRLLIDGAIVGDQDGRVACPTDLVNPLPWKR